MIIKRHLIFDLEKRKTTFENLPIRLRVIYSGNRVDISTGLRIDLDKWDSDTKIVKSGITLTEKKAAKEMNRELSEQANRINEIFTRFEHIEKKVPTPDELRNQFNILSGRAKKIQKDKTLFDYFDQFTLETGMQNSWTDATYTKFNAVRKHLVEFNSKLMLERLTEKDMNDYVQFLLGQNWMNTTLAKNLEFVRWFLRWAHKKGYYTGLLHESFKPKFKGTDGNSKEIIYLEWDELILLYHFDFKTAERTLPDETKKPLEEENRKALERIRDVFCFCCFTGLRYSDVRKLRRSDVKKDRIEFVTKKTTDSLIVELNDYSREILERYAEIGLPKNAALPVVANSNMNEQLKDMGELVGLKEPQRIVYFKGNTRYEEVYPKWALLTTHCGRRTFIINALTLGIPAEVILKFTGHSDFKAMKPYLKIVNSLKEQEMKKFNKK